MQARDRVVDILYLLGGQLEVSTSTVMVAKTLTFAVFAAEKVIQPAFEAAKVHVADENYCRSERFSQNGHKNSRDRHLRAVPLLRESGLSVGNSSRVPAAVALARSGGCSGAIPVAFAGSGRTALNLSGVRRLESRIAA